MNKNNTPTPETPQSQGIGASPSTASTGNCSTPINSSKVPIALQTVVSALRTYTGVDENQALTMAYYALATYHVEKFDVFPTLVFQGPMGTGKTDALEAMIQLVNKPRRILGRSFATLRDELGKCGQNTAVIDETDKLQGIEDLLTLRYGRNTGTIEVNRSLGDGQYQLGCLNLYGATVIVRRNPLSDAAMRSRSVIIGTRPKMSTYPKTPIPSVAQAAGRLIVPSIQTSDRISNTWKPLLALAQALDDSTWLAYAHKVIERELRQLQLCQGIEPTHAIIYVLRENPSSVLGGRIRVQDLKKALRDDFEVTLNAPQIIDLCGELGIRIVNTHGYPMVEIDPNQLDQTAASIGIRFDE